MKENTRYDTDSPATKDQAEALLKQYYKERRNEKNFPRRYNLLSWKLNNDGTMIVIDGASGRKLEFVTNEVVQERLKAEETAEDAEEELLDAEADAAIAKADADEKERLAKQLKTNAEMKAKAAKKAEKAEK